MDRRSSLFDILERLVSWQKSLPYVLLLTITFAIYGPSLYFDFVWDDIAYIADNTRIHGLSPQHLRMIWTSTYFGHYAPLHNLFLAVLYFFYDLEPFGYHLAQLLVHSACVGLLYFVLQRIESARVAFLATLLFAVYPPNIETVAWISETKSTLAFLFFLISFWTFLRFRESGQRWMGIVCAVFFLLSLLAKVSTIVAPTIFLLYDYKEGRLNRKNAGSLAAFFLIGFLFAAIHLGSFFESRQDFVTSYYGGPLVHLLNIPRFVLHYMGLVVFPHPLSAWQMFQVHEQFNGVLAVAWIALLALGWLLYRSSRSTQFWGLWFLAFLAPVLQVLPFQVWVADRYLYLPAIGPFVLGSKLFFQIIDRYSKRWQSVATEAAMGAILLAFAWHTHHHLPVWKNNLVLWRVTIETCMSSALCHANLGSALLRSGEVVPGVKELIRAIEIQPLPGYLLILGDAYALYVRDYRQALLAYNEVRKKGVPLTAGFYARVARAHLLAGHLDEARRALEEAKRLNPNDPGTAVVESFLQWKLGNWEGARASLEKALTESGQTAHPAGYLYLMWRDAEEVGRLLAELHFSPSANSAAH